MINDETLPGWLQAVARKLPFGWGKGLVTDGHYSVSTFDGHRLPERKTKQYMTNRKAFEKLPHLPAIHGLFEKAGGQALEVGVDKRGGLGHAVQVVTADPASLAGRAGKPPSRSAPRRGTRRLPTAYRP